ncbi:amidohydrolase family protein [Streptomyces sp. NPDC056949]|uniref:amidohydrolase family protein n=1 Tax=Streptomyces sp. NPDC056949 TaxID=3345976 RepID=UPI00363AA152
MALSDSPTVLLALRRLLPALHKRLDLHAQVQPADDLIRAATTTAARRLLREEGRIGTLAVGAQADLLVLDGNPLEDISVLTKPREHLRHVIKPGTPMRRTRSPAARLDRCRGSVAWRVATA